MGVEALVASQSTDAWFAPTLARLDVARRSRNGAHQMALAVHAARLNLAVTILMWQRGNVNSINQSMTKDKEKQLKMLRVTEISDQLLRCASRRRGRDVAIINQVSNCHRL